MKGLHFGVGVWFATAALASLMGGCAAAPEASERGDASKTGNVKMTLLGETDGTTYRLRNALFDVFGPTLTTLDSEIDPNAEELTATLQRGNYTILLRDGWSLERQQGMSFVTVEAALASTNPAAFQIFGGSTAQVRFRFSTGGEIVDMGQGTLSVDINVVERPGSSCDLFSQAGCRRGEACYFVDFELNATCSPEGDVPIGGECDVQEDCQADGLCATADAINFSCFEICQLGGDETCSAGTCSPTGVPGLAVCQ